MTPDNHSVGFDSSRTSRPFHGPVGGTQQTGSVIGHAC